MTPKNPNLSDAQGYFIFEVVGEKEPSLDGLKQEGWTNTIRSLVRRGLVEIVMDEDGVLELVRLTEEGRKLL